MCYLPSYIDFDHLFILLIKCQHVVKLQERHNDDVLTATSDLVTSYGHLRLLDQPRLFELVDVTVRVFHCIRKRCL